MTKRALIADGIVIQVVDTEEDQFPIHLAWEWVECPDETVPGWVYDDGSVVAAPLPEVSVYRTQRKAEFQAYYEAVISAGFLWGPDWYASDPTSMARLALMAQSAREAIIAETDGSWSREWPKRDGGWTTLTAANAIALMETGELHQSSSLLGLQEVFADLDAATTSEEVAMVEWPEG